MKITYDLAQGTFTLSVERAPEEYDERDGKLYVSVTIPSDALLDAIEGAQQNPGDTIVPGGDA